MKRILIWSVYSLLYPQTPLFTSLLFSLDYRTTEIILVRGAGGRRKGASFFPTMILDTGIKYKAQTFSYTLSQSFFKTEKRPRTFFHFLHKNVNTTWTVTMTESSNMIPVKVLARSQLWTNFCNNQFLRNRTGCEAGFPFYGKKSGFNPNRIERHSQNFLLTRNSELHTEVLKQCSWNVFSVHTWKLCSL